MIELESKTEQVMTFKGATRWYVHTIREGKIFQLDYHDKKEWLDEWMKEHAHKHAVLFMTRIDFPAVNQMDPCT